MTNKNENTGFWIGRVLMIFFFLFVLSFSENDSVSQLDAQIISIEEVGNVNNSAVPVEPLHFTDYNISLENCVHYNLKPQNAFDLRFSNNQINQQFKLERLKFYQLKPELLRLKIVHLKLSSSEEFLQIS